MLGTGDTSLADVFPGATIVNHEWWKPETFVTLGTIGADASTNCRAVCSVSRCRCAINRGS